MKEPLIHVACGAPAFRYERAAFVAGALIFASDAEHMDGTPIRVTEVMRCDSCGAHLMRAGRLRMDEVRFADE